MVRMDSPPGGPERSLHEAGKWSLNCNRDAKAMWTPTSESCRCRVELVPRTVCMLQAVEPGRQGYPELPEPRGLA